MWRVERDGDTATETKLYRRGLVLGLTLAEISLLLVFVLLLALGALLKRAEARAAAAERIERRATAAERSLREALSRFSSDAGTEEVDRWVRDVVAASAREQEAAEAKRQSAARAASLQAIGEAAREAGAKGVAETPQAITDAVTSQLGELRGLRAATETMRSAGKGAIERRVVDAELENQALRGTVANARRRLEALGKGSERPACWATREGRPEYIFDVALSAGGFTIHDRALPSRREQQARLPISMISFDATLSLDAFRAQTRPLFEWGESRGCRFFVVAADRTGSGQKEIFKQRLRGLEEHFYKFLSN